MDGFREGQNVWVEEPGGSLRPGVYVGDGGRRRKQDLVTFACSSSRRRLN